MNKPPCTLAKGYFRWSTVHGFTACAPWGPSDGRRLGGNRRC